MDHNKLSNSKTYLHKSNIEYNQIKKPHQMSFIEILIGIKDTWFDILDMSLKKRMTLESFTKNNKLFFIGITILIVLLLAYLLQIIFGGFSNTKSINKEITEIHHYYHNSPNIQLGNQT